MSSDGRRVKAADGEGGGRVLGVGGRGGEPSDWVSGSVRTSTGGPPNQLCILFIVLDATDNAIYPFTDLVVSYC